jgi:hypothetical protein
MSLSSTRLSTRQRYALLSVAVIQGILLYVLHESNDWALPFLYGAYALVATGPLLLALLIGALPMRRLLAWCLAFLASVVVMSVYTATQLLPDDQVREGSATVQLILAVIVLGFLVLTLAPSGWRTALESNQQRMSLGWHYALLVACAGLFALAVMALLVLWAALFEAIGIDFFEDLFTSVWFIYPASTLAVTAAILLLRERESVFVALGNLHTSLMRLLLILVALITVVFAMALPFTGLHALWESGGSTLLLCLQALMLFLLNSVYLSHLSRPYGSNIQWLVTAALLVLPLFSAISLYGLTERIAQHGFSVSRYWGLMIWALLALLAVGYSLCWLRWRQQWVAHIGRLNIVASLMLMATLVLVNTPLADLRQWTVDHQLARWQQGEIAAADLDIDYFYYDLARPGFLALQQLQTQIDDSDPALALAIHQRIRGESSSEPERQLVVSAIKGAEQAPEALQRQLQQDFSRSGWRHSAHQWWLKSVDANDDGVQEYVLIENHQHYQELTLYYQEQEQWRSQRLQYLSGPEDVRDVTPQDEAIAVEPPWLDIQIGGQIFAVEK